MGLLGIDGSCRSCVLESSREDLISALPDDLLVQILLLLPTKDAIATTILSKRWRYAWTMLPELEFKDEEGSNENIGWFTDKSLQLHKAPRLGSLSVELGPECPADVDVGKWVDKAVHGFVYKLDFNLQWMAEPKSFPNSLYTCDTLVALTLSNQILVDVSFPASLPCLLFLSLLYVVYKDHDSLVRLLSSCPVLKDLTVQRHKDCNLKNFTVKVPSLQTLYYMTDRVNDEIQEDDSDDEIEDDNGDVNDEIEDDDVNDDEIEDDNGDVNDEIEDDDVNDDEIEEDDSTGSLVIDSPALTDLSLFGVGKHYCLIENMPCLNRACLGAIHNPHEKFLTSLSSAKRLLLSLTQSIAACYNATKFSQLIEFHIRPSGSENWLEPLIFFLQNSPTLKTLIIDTCYKYLHPPSWNQPCTVPGCLSSHLEIFKWNDYGRGSGDDEKQLVTYILANSKRLKTVEFSLLSTCNLEERRKEIESMPRLSTSSQLLFPTETEWILGYMTE